MTGPAFRGRTLGERVAELRRRAGMSQKDLAGAVSRSESWVSQVERDVLPVERLSVLHSLADALGASMRDLRPETAAPSSVHDADPPPGLDRLTRAMTGPAALGAGLGTTRVDPRDVDELRVGVDEARRLERSARPAELDAVLAPLLTDLELAVRQARGRRRAQLATLLGQAYQVAAAGFARQHVADVGWLAADRAIRWAEETGDRLAPVAAGLRMGQAFLAMDMLDQAQHVAGAAVCALKPMVDAKDCPVAALSLYGAMQLLLADVHAREGDRARARAAVAAARAVAALIGQDRDDYDTGFGPSDVELHAVATAVELGDAGEAIELAATIDTASLSAARHARLAIDLARAHVQRRQVDEAIAALQDAQRHAPDELKVNAVARATVADLLSLVGPRRASAQLHELARTVGAVS